MRFLAFACVIGTGNTPVLVGTIRPLITESHQYVYPGVYRLIIDTQTERPQRLLNAAPCLAWGRVRCVYSVRAVTVPEHPLSRASCFLVHTRVHFYASWVQLGDPPGHAARRSTPTLDSTRGELRLRLRTQYNEPP